MINFLFNDEEDVFAKGLVFAFIILKGLHPYELKKYMSKSKNKEEMLEVVKENILEGNPVNLEGNLIYFVFLIMTNRYWV